MGGVPVLLMIAAMGITYGWQPDESGGVEYVIQIPPDQLHELERIGEISSAIDPAVQGHVSRVIIKVGKSPLPRIMPPNLARRPGMPQRDDRVMVASDQSPIPIPEMDQRRQAIPIASLDPSEFDSTNSLNRSDHAAVMKPQTSGTAGGSGFTFPSTQPFRDPAAATAGPIHSDVDLAGRALNTQTSKNAAAPTLGGNRVPPPATRSPNVSTLPQTPQFTGSDPTGQLARPRAGGPSTDPTNTRDNSWRDFAGSAAAGTSGLSNNPFDRRPATTQDNSLSSQRNASGLSRSDTFGKPPGGLTLPGAADQRATGFADRNPSPSAGVYSLAEQAARDRQSQYAAADRSRSAAITNGQRTSTGAYGLAGANAYNPSPGAASRQQVPAQMNPNPSSRLTAAQIAAGAWTVDIYGRPLDREGRLLTATTHPNQAVAAYDPTHRQDDRYTGRTQSSLGQPNANPPTFANTSAPSYPTQTQSQIRNTQTLPANPSFRRETAPSIRNAPSPGAGVARRDAAATQPQADPVALSDRRSASGVIGNAEAQQQQLASQPLFNGLLLISFVANLYLIFWLKNLRLQFHDLVAAKRIGSSTSATT